VPVSPLSGIGNGVAFLVSAGLVNEIIASDCSSPQTTEINADVRAETTMKWVYVGLVESAVFVVIAAKIEPRHAGAIILGGALAAGLKYGFYWHAKRAGLASSKPGTENW
jgi:hypothetical protein